MTEVFSPMASLRKTLSSARDFEHAVALLSVFLAEQKIFEGLAILSEDPASAQPSRVGVTFQQQKALIRGRDCGLPLFVSDAARQQIEPFLRDALHDHGIKSYVLLPLTVDGQIKALLELATTIKHLRLRGEDRAYLELVAVILSSLLERSLQSTPATSIKAFTPAEPPRQADTHAAAPVQEDHRRSLYSRVAEYGELLIVRTDSELNVTEIVGDTMQLFGATADELIRSPHFWRRSFRAADLRRVLRRARSLPATEFSEELSVVNRRTGEARWLLIRAIPVTDEHDSLVCWEGYWVDITARRNAEERSHVQGRRIEALYEVARSLELNLDPSVVALKGLRALIKATASDCGFSGLLDGSSGQLEVVAAEGLSSYYIEEIGRIIGKQTIAREAVERREGVLLADIQQEPRAAVELARREGVRATIIMPLVFEEHVLGVMVLFRRDDSQYSTDDYDLVAAACSQIALAARQAELYAAEKRHSSSLSALYRLSHELSKQMTLKEVAEHAFPAIQEEIACKRMWLGVMNNRGSHLIGTAGVGPGIRKHVIDLQVEIGVRNDDLDQALRKRSPVVVDMATRPECGEIGKVLRRLNCGTIVVVPLVSLGQVVGALVVEPAVPSAFFVQRKLPLLNSMATEIATVILARKFEARMADADKMRMAGLLASGVAHNFNNLLQAVMGQASLIEMQMPHEGKIVQSARMIADAASKGAALVKQLFNFSMQGGFAPAPLSMSGFLRDSHELYRSVLGSGITLEYDIADDLPEVVADSTQLQQVFTNLLVNSKEALEGRSDGRVRVFCRRAKVRSGEIDPELAPGEYLSVEIEDNGSGMTPESQSRCFEPFFTTKNTDARTGLGFGGSGLGLSSAYSIIKQHEGAITVRSQLSKGTTFTVYLPASARQAQNVSARTAPASAQARSNVVMFEIDSAIAYSLRSALESTQVSVSLPLTRERLLQLVDQMRGEKTIVLVDLDRIGQHAPELVSQLLKDHERVRVLGYVADLSVWEGRQLGNGRCRLFEKPLRIWSMSEHVREIVDEPAAAGLSGLVSEERTALKRGSDKQGQGSGGLVGMPPLPEGLDRAKKLSPLPTSTGMAGDGKKS